MTGSTWPPPFQRRFPRAGQRPTGASGSQGRGRALPAPVGWQEDDGVRLDANPLSQCHLVAEEPVLRRCLRLRQKRQPNPDRRWRGPRDLWAPSASPGVRDPVEGSSRGLHRPGRIPAQSDAARRQRLWPQGWREVRSWRPRLARRVAGLWLVRSAAVCRLYWTIQPPSIDATAATRRSAHPGV